jgi:hypothetical protein
MQQSTFFSCFYFYQSTDVNVLASKIKDREAVTKKGLPINHTQDMKILLEIGFLNSAKQSLKSTFIPYVFRVQACQMFQMSSGEKQAA